MYPLERDASRRASELADAFGIYTQQDKRCMESALRGCRFTYMWAGIVIGAIILFFMFVSLAPATI
jgi:Zn-dependent membrane protease YugP